MATSSNFWLLGRIRAAKGPLAFVDESFLSPSEDADTFYILGAVVIEKSKVFAVRKELREIVGDDYFHATEFGRTDYGRMIIRRMAAMLARQTQPILVVLDQLEKKDRDAELARELATRGLWKELAENELYLTGTVIYEGRLRGNQHRQDLRIFRDLKKENLPGSKLRVLGLPTKREPLLWAPDLVCWAFRQAYHEGNPSYFQELTKTTKIIRL